MLSDMILMLPFMEGVQQAELIFKMRVAQNTLSKILDKVLEVLNLILQNDSGEISS